MGTIENIMADEEQTRKFLKLGMRDSQIKADLWNVINDPPALHNCILEIQAYDGTWHEREPADWVQCVFLHGIHVGRVKYRELMPDAT